MHSKNGRRRTASQSPDYVAQQTSLLMMAEPFVGSILGRLSKVQAEHVIEQHEALCAENKWGLWKKYDPQNPWGLEGL